MLRIHTIADARQRIRLAIEGNLCDETVELLREAIDDALRRDQHVQLDLHAVDLVGRRALEYLVATIGPEVKVVRCPAYVERWIASETVDRATD